MSDDGQQQPALPRRSGAKIDRRRFLAVSGLAGAAAMFGPGVVGPIAASADPVLTYGDADRPPFSFTYGGTAFAALMSRWTRTGPTSRTVGSRTETTVTWTDPASGLKVEWIRTTYTGYTTASWHVRFTNTGRANSLQLADVLAVDLDFTGIDDGGWTIHTADGSASLVTDFEPHDLSLAANTFRVFTTGGGRPTDGYLNPDTSGTNIGGAFPYYNVDWGDGGVLFAVGWPGQWCAEIGRPSATSLSLTGGMCQNGNAAPGDHIDVMQLTNLYLEPGETIRTPMVVLQQYAGVDWIDGQNLWRRWMIDHHMPRMSDGRPSQPLMPTQANDYFPGQTDTARDELTWLNAYGTNGATAGTGGVHDHWWIDAGWQETPTDWTVVGTWDPDPVRFPDGLRPITDRARELGMKAIVWFEPERVMPDTWLADNHPEWLLSPPPGYGMWDGRAKLLNFGNPDALAWIKRKINDVIDTEGIDFYREDFNITPGDIWAYNDPAGRRGITQAKYVEGHLSYWQALLDGTPGMRIDTCASGGRRVDVQSLALSIPLLRSDYVLNATGNQSHTYGASPWIPISGGGARATGAADDVYQLRSMIAPSAHTAVDVSQPSPPWATLKQIAREWNDVKAHFLGDWYPLTGYSIAEDVWMAWQFNQRDGSAGVVQAFRRPRATAATLSVALRGLRSSGLYSVYNYATARTTSVFGSSLARALSIALSAGQATTIRYRRVL